MGLIRLYQWASIDSVDKIDSIDKIERGSNRQNLLRPRINKKAAKHRPCGRMLSGRLRVENIIKGVLKSLKPAGIVALWVCFSWALALRAQYREPSSWPDVSQNWIAQPCGDGCHDVWFSQKYQLDEAPQRLTLTISTTGWVDVYVNGRNVSTSLLTPFLPNADREILSASYDVTAFARQGLNTVAIDYSPRQSHCRGCGLCLLNQDSLSTDSISRISTDVSLNDTVGQIAVSLCHTDEEGKTSFVYTDGSWLCRTGRRRLTSDGGELIDGREADPRQGFRDDEQMLWTPAMEVASPMLQCGSVVAEESMSLSLNQVSQPDYRYYSNDAYVYLFPEAAFGYMRLTLRDCRCGDLISLDRLHYICRGEPDEQAVGKFAPQTLRQVSITGPEHFTRDNVFMIERLAVGFKY